MNSLAIPTKAEFSETGLSLPDSITFEEWQQCGDYLKRIDRACQWWIGDWLNAGEQRWGEMYAQAVDETDVAYMTLAEYKWVAKAIPFSVRTEKVPFGVCRQIAAMPADQRGGAIQRAADEGWTVRDARQHVRISKAQMIAREDRAFPSGKYRVLYADPPWAYGNEMAQYATTPLDHYPAMSTDDICAMPIRDIAMPDSVLFMWTTCPHLPEAFQVLDAWGFKYKAQFVWDKVKHNMGHYNSVRHELLLIAVRGSCTPDVLKQFDSVYSEERTTHSKKPEFFREVINTIYPHGPRIELFARVATEGWHVWGNESPGHVQEQSAA